MEKENKKRNYNNEKKWAKEKYGRLEAKLDKELVEKFKNYLHKKNIKYQKWLKDKIKEEIK